MRENLAAMAAQAVENDSCSAEIKELLNEWLANKDDVAKSEEISARLVPMLEAADCPLCKEILEMKDYFVKKSLWSSVVNGWAYDIGRWFGSRVASGKM